MLTNLRIATLLASVILVDTACPTSQIDRITVSKIADAIFRAEGGTNTHHPYGIMIQCHNPRRVCINTINHAWRDFERQGTKDSMTRHEDKDTNREVCKYVTLPFIQFLGSRYCPPSVDAIGYRNWTNNVFKILHENFKTSK